MQVFARAEQLQNVTSTWSSEGSDFAYKPVVSASFADEDVSHVYFDRADGRFRGNPTLGVAIGIRGTRTRLAAMQRQDFERLSKQVCEELGWEAPGVLVMFCEFGIDDAQAVAGVFDPPSCSWHAGVLQLIPFWDGLFSRTTGIFETDALRNRSVTLVGLGSGGAMCAMELARAGVGRFHLFDFDRLEPHNIARHVCGVSSLGRLKTRAVRDAILDTNPSAVVEMVEKDIAEVPDLLDHAVQSTDVTIGATDNNVSRGIINRAALRHGKVCIFGRAGLRACGGDVLRVRPRAGACYECVIPMLAANAPEEVSHANQVGVHAYSDRPVVAMPGLATDIMPIANMVVRLALVELARLSNKPMAALDQDLTADLYVWANRREANYASWAPMQYSLGRMSILRWYPVRTTRLPSCPGCGSFRADVAVRPETLSMFLGDDSSEVSGTSNSD